MVNYNVDALRASIRRHVGNIANFEKAIALEREQIRLFEGHIIEALNRPKTNIVLDAANNLAPHDDGAG